MLLGFMAVKHSFKLKRQNSIKFLTLTTTFQGGFQKGINDTYSVQAIFEITVKELSYIVHKNKFE
jgi:hypothetical protein